MQPTIRMPEPQRQALLGWAVEKHLDARPHDFRIGSPGDPYLLRWFVVRQGQEWLNLSPDERRQIIERKQHGREEQSDGTPDQVNIFVHQFWRSDDDRALHDHPWPWASIILDGHYLEHRAADPDNPARETKATLRQAGDIVITPDARTPHRVELTDHCPVTTLFMTGPKCREWGFWCSWGWRHWREFTAAGDSGSIGPGCE